MWASKIRFDDYSFSYKMRRLDLLTGTWHDEPAQYSAEVLAHKLPDADWLRYRTANKSTDLYHMDADGTLTVHSKSLRYRQFKCWSSYRVALT